MQTGNHDRSYPSLLQLIDDRRGVRLRVDLTPSVVGVGGIEDDKPRPVRDRFFHACAHAVRIVAVDACVDDLHVVSARAQKRFQPGRPRVRSPDAPSERVARAHRHDPEFLRLDFGRDDRSGNERRCTDESARRANSLGNRIRARLNHQRPPL